MTQQLEKQEPIDVLGILKILSDPIGSQMFRYISGNGEWARTDRIRDFAPTNKKFYSRIHKLVEAGVLRRYNQGGYQLTSYGRVIADIHDLFHQAAECYYGFKIIDTLRKEKTDLPEEEYTKLITTLIPDEKIRDMLRR
jgi:hypothetical protein